MGGGPWEQGRGLGSGGGPWQGRGRGGSYPLEEVLGSVLRRPAPAGFRS